jgi:hypothetical protein
LKVREKRFVVTIEDRVDDLVGIEIILARNNMNCFGQYKKTGGQGFGSLSFEGVEFDNGGFHSESG